MSLAIFWIGHGALIVLQKGFILTISLLETEFDGENYDVRKFNA